MNIPNQDILERAVVLLATSCQADMAVVFNPSPTVEQIQTAFEANAAWEQFLAEHPELEVYIEEMGL